VLVTGGCRSGKSAYAQQLAEALPPPRLYIATCPVTDEEMQRRIDEHRRARRDRGWDTIEEETDLTGVLSRAGSYRVRLVDCVTLWINNLMYHGQGQGLKITEAQVSLHCSRVLEAARACPGTVIFVTNEVGLGVVPANAQARLYRDLLGRANQVLAEHADTVTLMVCGIPWHMKKGMRDEG
jgi:adenosylcobinamide kinase/adenosylcobinamide-phosphate guanylyltransferase